MLHISSSTKPNWASHKVIGSQPKSSSSTLNPIDALGKVILEKETESERERNKQKNKIHGGGGTEPMTINDQTSFQMNAKSDGFPV